MKYDPQPLRFSWEQKRNLVRTIKSRLNLGAGDMNNAELSTWTRVGLQMWIIGLQGFINSDIE